MDPFSISVGALQIATICSQCTIQIIKWVGDVRTVETRIRGFYDEVLALQSTYEGLEESLRSPLMIEAARVAHQTSDGAHLWTQVRIALDDSTKTMKRIKLVLDEISKHTGPLRSVKKQLAESLSNGELSRLRQRVQFFNATISLPIQMVCVMLQLEQRGMSAHHQRQLDAKFVSLERMMRDLIASLTRPSRSNTMMSGSTLIVGATDEYTDTEGKDSYLSFAKKILSSASAAASHKSSLSTVTPQAEPPPLIELSVGPPPYSQQPQQDRTRDWIPAPCQPLNETQSPSDLPPAVPPESPMPRGKSFEVAYKLAQTHLKLGQEKADQENHESAERSFRKALDLLAKHDFAGRIAFQPAEVVLMLSRSCLQQKKYDEAIDLLTPVAVRESDIFPQTGGRLAAAISPSSRPDTLQGLAASHMLGEVYRQKGDFELAKEHALKAFLERTDELGETDEKTLDSVKLVIDVYRDMGDEEEAEAYEVFLSPSSPIQSPDISTQPRPGAATEDETAVASMSPPPSEMIAINTTNQQSKPSKPSFGFLRNIKRMSQANLGERPSIDSTRLSFSRTATLDDANPSSIYLLANRTEKRHMSSPSEASHERTNSYIDDVSTVSSAVRLERSPSIKTLEPTFLAVQQLCIEGRHSKAVKVAISFLESYGSSVFVIRRDALEKNIREGGSKGLSATGHGYAPLHFFCELKEECVDEVSLLLKYGADPNAVAYKAGYSAGTDVLSPLHLAIRRGHTAIAQLLLEVKDLKPDIKDGAGHYPLFVACRNRNYAVVTELLTRAPKSIPRESELSAACYGNSLLHDAARHCDLRLVEILLATGLFDINQQDKFGKTPLIYAVIKSDVSNLIEKAKMLSQRLQVVQKLLDTGSDRNLVDVKGMTAKSYAEREKEIEGSRELVSMLGVVRFEMA